MKGRTGAAERKADDRRVGNINAADECRHDFDVCGNHMMAATKAIVLLTGAAANGAAARLPRGTEVLDA